MEVTYILLEDLSSIHEPSADIIDNYDVIERQK